MDTFEYYEGGKLMRVGLDRDGKTQRYVPVKNGAMASPGYIVNVHNGQPFGRFGIGDASPCLTFMTGSRADGDLPSTVRGVRLLVAGRDVGLG